MDSLSNYYVGIAVDHQKQWKQGRDDSIKQFSTQLHPTYLSTIVFVFYTVLTGPSILLNVIC